jgi:RNA polymerase II subunit A small phosphatase-like protein
MPSYSEEIIDRLPGISYKLFRYHATRIKNKTIKDLSRLGRPLEKLVIVDNEEDNFALQRENGIKIGDWVATDPADQ